MYQIAYSEKFDEFKFIANKETVVSGNLLMVSLMAQQFGISEFELAAAFKDMRENDTTVAEFGMGKYFMFSR